MRLQLFKARKGILALVALPLVGLGVAVGMKEPAPYVVHLCQVIIQYRVVVHPVLYAAHANVNATRVSSLKRGTVLSYRGFIHSVL